MGNLIDTNVWDVYQTLVDLSVDGSIAQSALVRAVDSQVPEILGKGGRPNSYDLYGENPARYGPVFEDGLTLAVLREKAFPRLAPGAAEALEKNCDKGNYQLAFSTGFKSESHLLLQKVALLSVIDDIVTSWTNNDQADKSPEAFIELIENARKGTYCDGQGLRIVTFTDDKAKYVKKAGLARAELGLHKDDFRLFHLDRLGSGDVGLQEVTEDGVTFYRVSNLRLVE